jgi:hypothetical protein
LVLDVLAEPSTTPAGGAGGFDVLVRNDAGSTESVTLAGFSVDLGISSSSEITFTSIDTNTAIPYIFDGNTLGFFVTVQDSHEVSGNDIAAVGGTLLIPGASFALAHVSYTVALNATPGVYPVTFLGILSGTSLTDAAFNNLVFTPIDGSITVTSSGAVPEPSSLVMLGLGSLGLIAAGLRRR